MKINIFKLKYAAYDDKITYLFANNILHKSFICFLLLWVMSLIANISLLFYLGIICLGCGTGMYFAVKRLNRTQQ